MYIVLSQKIDTDSSYSDELFVTYHFPVRYKNQIHTGDEFVYYQGNRYEKEQRYYFGSGVIGRINTTDEESYYAELKACVRFENKVSIYLNDGGYIEQKGYETVRRSPNPPWQSSIRPLSAEAFNYILSKAGTAKPLIDATTVEQLKTDLKKAVKDFYVKGDSNAILSVNQISKSIISALEIDTPSKLDRLAEIIDIFDEPKSAKKALFDYCKSMRMSYSYKPVLIMAIIDAGTVGGTISIYKATRYFRDYYKSRQNSGLKIEKGNCIYNDLSVSDETIAGNIVSNPVKALLASGYFTFNVENMDFAIKSEIWATLSDSNKAELRSHCVTKLDKYYSSK